MGMPADVGFIDVAVDGNAVALLSEEQDENIVKEDDVGVSFSLISVCGATKEAH